MRAFLLLIFAVSVLLTGCAELIVANLVVSGAVALSEKLQESKNDASSSSGDSSNLPASVKSSMEECVDSFNDGTPIPNAINYCELALAKGEGGELQLASMYEKGSGGASTNKSKALQLYKLCANKLHSPEREFNACKSKVKMLEAALAETTQPSPIPQVSADRPKNSNKPNDTPKKVHEYQKESAKKITFTGSGFFVAKSLAVTNRHVIEGCSEVKIRYLNQDFPARVKAVSATYDLALIDTDLQVKNLPSLRSAASLGEEVMVAGFPLAGLLGTDLIVTSGQVNSLAGLGNDSRFLQISAPVQPGNSGGPLIDRNGGIVGVVVSKLNVTKVNEILGDSPQNVNFAIKPEFLKIFLTTNRVVFSQTPNPNRYDGIALAKQARVYTLQVLCF